MMCKNPYMSGVLPCPCGQCIPCRINRRRVWTLRMLLESYVSEKSCFLTLTYDDDHIPGDLSLNPRHTQLFMKKLRKAVSPAALRFFCIGEYGGSKYGSTNASREVNPHYHFALYGFNCDERISIPEFGKRCFCGNCELVRRTWGFGNILVEPLDRGTAQYIARYVVKKLTKHGDALLEGRYPEFQRSSNRPGIGAKAVDSIFRSFVDPSTGEIYLNDKGDVSGQLNVDGRMMPLGRYIHGKLREKTSSKEGAKLRFEQELLSLWDNAVTDKAPHARPLSMKHLLLDVYKGRQALLESQFNIYLRKGSL